MPLGDRIRGRHRHAREIHDGDEYTKDEEDRGEVRLVVVEPDPDPPPEELRGEVWGPGKWTADFHPRGWPGPDHPRSEPGPYDGLWERPDDWPETEVRHGAD